MMDAPLFDIQWCGELVSGVTIFGLRSMSESPLSDFVAEDWPMELGHDIGRLFGDHWEVFQVSVRVDLEALDQAAFQRMVDASLESLLAQGCRVSWLGTVGAFADPPDLFTPRYMAEGVFALRTKGARTTWNLSDTGVVLSLPDEELLGARRYCAGLADAP